MQSLRRYIRRLPPTHPSTVLFDEPKVWTLVWSMLAEAPAITSNDFDVVAYVGTQQFRGCQELQVLQD